MISSLGCAQCGRSGVELEYGSDGLGYCSSCHFYGMNKQCNRCKMFLPSVEIQQFCGQQLCPYCIRDARKEMIDSESPHATQTHVTELRRESAHCDRCGNESSKLYQWNGMQLCKHCLDEGQKMWQVVSASPIPVSEINVTQIRTQEKQKDAPVLNRILQSMGLQSKKKEENPRGEIVAVPPKTQTQKIPNLDLARPMSEGKSNSSASLELEHHSDSLPENEGLIRNVPTKKPPKKDK